MDPEGRISEALRRWDARLDKFEDAVGENTVAVAKLTTSVGYLRYIILSVLVVFDLGIAGLLTKQATEAEPQDPASAIVQTR